VSLLLVKDFAQRHREAILWCLSSAAIAAYFALRWFFPYRGALAPTPSGYPSAPTQGEYVWAYRLAIVVVFSLLGSLVFNLWLEDAE
jgi:hypothetical protein